MADNWASFSMENSFGSLGTFEVNRFDSMFDRAGAEHAGEDSTPSTCNGVSNQVSSDSNIARVNRHDGCSSERSMPQGGAGPADDDLISSNKPCSITATSHRQLCGSASNSSSRKHQRRRHSSDSNTKMHKARSNRELKQEGSSRRSREPNQNNSSGKSRRSSNRSSSREQNNECVAQFNPDLPKGHLMSSIDIIEAAWFEEQNMSSTDMAVNEKSLRTDELSNSFRDTCSLSELSSASKLGSVSEMSSIGDLHSSEHFESKGLESGPFTYTAEVNESCDKGSYLPSELSSIPKASTQKTRRKSFGGLMDLYRKGRDKGEEHSASGLDEETPEAPVVRATADNAIITEETKSSEETDGRKRMKRRPSLKDLIFPKVSESKETESDSKMNQAASYANKILKASEAKPQYEKGVFKKSHSFRGLFGGTGRTLLSDNESSDDGSHGSFAEEESRHACEKQASDRRESTSNSHRRRHSDNRAVEQTRPSTKTRSKDRPSDHQTKTETQLMTESCRGKEPTEHGQRRHSHTNSSSNKGRMNKSDHKPCEEQARSRAERGGLHNEPARASHRESRRSSYRESRRSSYREKKESFSKRPIRASSHRDLRQDSKRNLRKLSLSHDQTTRASSGRGKLLQDSSEIATRRSSHHSAESNKELMESNHTESRHRSSRSLSKHSSNRDRTAVDPIRASSHRDLRQDSKRNLRKLSLSHDQTTRASSGRGKLLQDSSEIATRRSSHHSAESNKEWVESNHTESRHRSSRSLSKHSSNRDRTAVDPMKQEEDCKTIEVPDDSVKNTLNSSEHVKGRMRLSSSSARRSFRRSSSTAQVA